MSSPSIPGYVPTEQHQALQADLERITNERNELHARVRELEEAAASRSASSVSANSARDDFSELYAHTAAQLVKALESVNRCTAETAAAVQEAHTLKSGKAELEVRLNHLRNEVARLKCLAPKSNVATLNVDAAPPVSTRAFYKYTNEDDNKASNRFGLGRKAQYDFDEIAYNTHCDDGTTALMIHHQTHSVGVLPDRQFVIPCATVLPHKEEGVKLYCAECAKLGKTVPLTNEGITGKQPRVIYTLNGPMHLISCLYRASSTESNKCCPHTYTSTEESIIAQTRQKKLPFFFRQQLVFDNGFTQLLMSTTSHTKTSVDRFKANMDAVYQALYVGRYIAWINAHRVNNAPPNNRSAKNPKQTSIIGFQHPYFDNKPPDFEPWTTPSSDALHDALKEAYEIIAPIQDWTQRQFVAGSTILGGDHFHSSSRDSKLGGVVKTACGAYSVLNQHKYVIHCPWTKGTAMEELREMWSQIVSLQPKSCATQKTCAVVYVDKCCGQGSFGDGIKAMMPAAQVKLDLFHAFRRVAKVLDVSNNQRHKNFLFKFQRVHYVYAPSVNEQKLPHDVDPGLKSIPPPAELANALLAVFEEFSDVVGGLTKADEENAAHTRDLTGKASSRRGSDPSAAIVDALKKHMFHVNNGCLSDPQGIQLSFTNEDGVVETARGSSQNECFHRVMTMSSRKSTVIGTQYASGIFRWQVYDWNMKQWVKKTTVHGGARRLWNAQWMLRELYEARDAFTYHDNQHRVNPFDAFLLPPRFKEHLGQAKVVQYNPKAPTVFPSDFTPFNKYNTNVNTVIVKCKKGFQKKKQSQTFAQNISHKKLKEH